LRGSVDIRPDRNSTRGHLFEELSRIPSPNFENDYVRAEESAKRDKSRKDKLRLRQRDGGGGGGGGADKDDHDDGTSFVLPLMSEFVQYSRVL